MLAVRTIVLFFCSMALGVGSQQGEGRVAEGGGSYRLFWEDGRVAKPVVETLDTVMFSLGMVQTKNTCAAVVGSVDVSA